MSTKNRTELKAYFEAGKKPTENQFTDFIEATINQAEDGIEKKPGEPLRITAEDLEINSKIALNAPLTTSTSGKENEVFISAEENTLKLSAMEVKLSGNISMNNLSTSKTLGDETTSDTVIPSQKAVKNYIDTRLPSGLISMWSGIEIPEGWALCNGENNTPDLRGRFVVGFDKENPEYNQTKKIGGQETVTLTIGQMPAHNHTGKTVSSGAHTHKFTGATKKGDGGGTGSSNAYYGTLSRNTQSAGAHTHSFTSDKTGSNEPQENRPPYYVLAYIIKL